MIVAQLENLPHQLAMNTLFEKAYEFLSRKTWRDQPQGRIEIDGDRVFALMQSYQTKAMQNDALFEGHRNYIDIQYIVEGEEVIYWMPTDHLTPTTLYDGAKDVWLCQYTFNDATRVILSAGQLAVLFPEDAHAPTHSVVAPTFVRKIVIKVATQG